MNRSESLLQGVAEIAKALRSHDVSYALIGGMAVGFRALPRYTEDINVLLRIPQVQLPAVLETLKANGFDLDLMQVIRDLNTTHMAVVRFRGFRVDLFKPPLGCIDRIIDDATEIDWLGTPTRVASVEGLIILKALANRPQDRVDIEKLLTANRGLVNVEQVRSSLRECLPDNDRRLISCENLIYNYYTL
jgi:predicted nucleotidyltransferase